MERPEKAESGTAEVVLIEDTSLDVFLVRETILVHKIPVDLRTIDNGELAFRYLDKIEAEELPCPQLFLLDLNLPKHGGHEILARIRQGRLSAKIPVVIVSSSDAPKDIARAKELGADAYFRKPTGYAAFLKLGEVMRRLLGLGPCQSMSVTENV